MQGCDGMERVKISLYGGGTSKVPRASYHLDVGHSLPSHSRATFAYVRLVHHPYVEITEVQTRAGASIAALLGLLLLLLRWGLRRWRENRKGRLLLLLLLLLLLKEGSRVTGGGGRGERRKGREWKGKIPRRRDGVDQSRLRTTLQAPPFVLPKQGGGLLLLLLQRDVTRTVFPLTRRRGSHSSRR
jgi:hypothetical protein